MELEGRELLCDCVLSATGRGGAVDGLNLEAGRGRGQNLSSSSPPVCCFVANLCSPSKSG